MRVPITPAEAPTDYSHLDLSHLDAPVPCTPDGWTVGGYSRPIWTPAGFLARGDVYLLTCGDCGHAASAPLQALVDAGKGDLPMHTFSGKWRCTVEGCGSRAITVSLELSGRKKRP